MSLTVNCCCCVVPQIQEWVLSYDGVNQPEPLAITAAAAALLVSGEFASSQLECVYCKTLYPVVLEARAGLET